MSDSVVRVSLVRSACSFAAHASRQSGRMYGFEYFSSLLTNVKESRRGRPKMIWAGDRSQSLSGVFLSWSMARKKRSWLRLPVGLVLHISRRFAALTATSARPLDCGNATEDTRWRTPQRRRNCSVWVAVNSGPPSLDSSSGTPKVANRARRWRTRPAEPPWSLPDVEPNTSTQPDNRSPTTR